MMSFTGQANWAKMTSPSSGNTKGEVSLYH